jgi:hypothetical protein
MDYKEIEQVIEVPKNTGVSGFLKTIESILKLPRVQNISVNAIGRVTYRRFLKDGESDEVLKVDFESLMPYAVIRNSTVLELAKPSENAAVALGQLFEMASRDQLNPVAFVGGANTNFWAWYAASTKLSIFVREEVHGIPFLTDRQLEDGVLVLCAAYARAGILVDTQKSYKLVIPRLE